MSAAAPANVPARKSFAQVAAAANIPVITKDARMSRSDGKDAKSIVEQNGAVQQGVAEKRSPDPVANGSAKENDPMEQVAGLLKATSLEDGGQGQLIAENAKIENSDTKSVASRGTLALDEKESLRPDDSASMQAAAEEDALSPSGSAVAGSSNDDVRAFRDQLHEIDRTGTLRRTAAHQAATMESRTNTEQRNGRIVYAAPPVAGSFNPIDAVPATSGDQNLGRPPNGLIIPPDEKLLEALASPKDRLFVLKIEQDMIDFVKDSTEQFLQLPQTNSFYRMLSHKLADYYLLGHVIDESMTSVRIYRTPYCRLPPPLIGPDPTTEGVTPPPNMPTRKIMRRGVEDEDVKPSSNAGDGINESKSASKTTSELGRGSGSDDGKDTPNKVKDKSAMTREERENWYNEARARIFKDFKEDAVEVVDGSVGQNETGLSRSSSVSGVKKNKKTPRKQPKDDTFEARSAYSQFAPQAYTQNVAPQPGVNGMYFDPAANAQLAGHFPTVNPSFIPNQQPAMPAYSHVGVGPQDQSQYYPWSGQPAAPGTMIPQNGFAPHQFSQDYYNGVNEMGGGMQSFPSPNMASQSTPKQTSSSLSNYTHGFQPQNQHGAWQQQYYQTSYGLSPNQQYHVNNTLQAMPSYDPTMYQYQNQPSFGGSPLPAHAIPGYPPQYTYNNANRAQFNPRTQAFVPAMQGMRPPQHQSWIPPSGPFPTGAGRFAAAPPALQRQGSGTSQMSGFSSPHPQQTTPNRNRPNGQANAPAQGQPVRNIQQGQSSISKWGAPPNLPPKPPPPATSLSFQVPRNSESQQPLPPHPFSSGNEAQGVGSANGQNT